MRALRWKVFRIMFALLSWPPAVILLLRLTLFVVVCYFWILFLIILFK